jgi:1-aminocyclopropane-1-carboxylate deaminase/D-cysteine desulfhydrase-like pyridoxal-dependent ACC family enzyme
VNSTIFPVQSLVREKCRWDDYLDVLTPIDNKASGRRYKREDYFAPLGYGGINGSKLRQLVFLVKQYRRQGGRAGLITAASVLSPQVSMAALVAKHFRLPTLIVLGGTKPRTSVKHENVAIAAMAGASFAYAPVGYNPTLQKEVDRMMSERALNGFFRLHYGITTPGSCPNADVEAFHAVGAKQAANIPDDIETLIMPAGSCNSCTSVLLGIARNPPRSLKRVVLLGIGPTRLHWIRGRLEQIRRVTGEDVAGLFRHKYHDHPGDEPRATASARYELEHYDLHSTGYVSYAARMPYKLDGIVFHPTYEGKCMTFMRERAARFQGWWKGDERTMFWIVGSKPTAGAMMRHLK